MGDTSTITQRFCDDAEPDAIVATLTSVVNDGNVTIWLSNRASLTEPLVNLARARTRADYDCNRTRL